MYMGFQFSVRRFRVLELGVSLLVGFKTKGLRFSYNPLRTFGILNSWLNCTSHLLTSSTP